MRLFKSPCGSIIDSVKKIEMQEPRQVAGHIFANGDYWDFIEAVADMLADDHAHLANPQPIIINQWTSLWVRDSTTKTIICKNPQCREFHMNARRVFTAGKCTGRFTWIVSEYGAHLDTVTIPIICCDFMDMLEAGTSMRSMVRRAPSAGTIMLTTDRFDPIRFHIVAARVNIHPTAVIALQHLSRHILSFDPSLFDQTFVCKHCGEELYGIFCATPRKNSLYATCIECTDYSQTCCLMWHPITILQKINMCLASGKFSPLEHSICSAATRSTTIIRLLDRPVALLGNEYVAVEDPLWLLACVDDRWGDKKIITWAFEKSLAK